MTIFVCNISITIMDKAKEQKSVEQLEKVKSNTKDQNLINKINEKISNINKPLNK